VWSMDFVFDRVAGGRAIKNLAIVDDATHEAVAVVPEHSISSRQLVRILEQICSRRGYPKVVRTDNGKEFCGRAMLAWAHEGKRSAKSRDWEWEFYKNVLKEPGSKAGLLFYFIEAAGRAHRGAAR